MFLSQQSAAIFQYMGCLWPESDRLLGLAVVVVAGVLVPFTYGITLPVVFPDRDLILYRRVAEMGVCYLCRVEYRGIKVPKRHPVVPPPPARQLREPHER